MAKNKKNGFVYTYRTYDIDLNLERKIENWKCYTRQIRYAAEDRFDGEIFGTRSYQIFAGKSHFDVLRNIKIALNKNYYRMYKIIPDKHK